ncbi:MAG: GHKL domain-containing protein [Candidatus Omnitrophica bacterium]|nr:GHKL domain-containing protein [Candidatus Omnitrophota bacterium]
MLTNKKPLYALILFRFVIATVMLIVNTALFGLARMPVYFLIGIIYVLTIVYLLLILANVSNKTFLYIQIILDIFIETLLVIYTGGIDSVVSLLFPLSSIAASIVISPGAGIIMALLASIFYSAVVSLDFFNLLFLPGQITSVFGKQGAYVFSLLYFKVTVFFIIGFLSAYIADQLKKKDKAVIFLQERLRREDRLSAIGKLAASAAHEIRNPLASISGCVESLKNSLKLEEKNEKLFNLVIKETGRLNNIINGLLEYVKPRRLQLETTDISGLLDEVILLVKNSRDFKTEVILNKDESFPSANIKCDPQQIKQVFFNLLINAVEAVKKNGKILIKGRPVNQNRDFEIVIIDNGIGISEELLESIFEPFSSGKENGVGLGLSIASAIINEHSGKITVKSTQGKGTSFYVCLPFESEERRR